MALKASMSSVVIFLYLSLRGGSSFAARAGVLVKLRACCESAALLYCRFATALRCRRWRGSEARAAQAGVTAERNARDAVKPTRFMIAGATNRLQIRQECNSWIGGRFSDELRLDTLAQERTVI